MSTTTALPFEPLHRYAGMARPQKLADRIGFSARTVQRWITVGTIPWESADAAAIRLGARPSLVWPDIWETQTAQQAA